MSQRIAIEFLDVSRFFPDLKNSKDFESDQFNALFNVKDEIRRNSSLTPSNRRSLVAEVMHPGEKTVLSGYFDDVARVTSILQKQGFKYQAPAVQNIEGERTLVIIAGFNPDPYQKK